MVTWVSPTLKTVFGNTVEKFLTLTFELFLKLPTTD